ncbi:MAG: NAD(+) synthase [Lachnospiraceae bacterium]|nr:NAD(+) synthase [Lachnospiraceae bacterium]MBR6273496.1 NAD(+) synthase [Lachnospiraceae bacterium]
MYDYIRVSSAVPDIRVADTDFNIQEISTKILEAEATGSDIVVFPELSITGYTCADLFFQKSLLAKSMEAVSRIVMASRRHKLIIVVGAPVKINGQLYNCACVIRNGKLYGIVPKTFLPNYSEFYEKRWFSSGAELTRENISAAELEIFHKEDYEIPIGRNLIFSINGSVNFGIEICEDLWTPLPPSTMLALGGAELILNLSASNETIAKREYRRQLVANQSGRNLCGYVYTSAGSTESTTDLIFSGNSIIAENGSIIKENEKLIDSDYMITADIDIGKSIHDRMLNKSFKDTAALYAGTEKFRYIEINSEDLLSGEGDFARLNRMPFVPSARADRYKRCMNIFEMQVAGLVKRLKVTGAKPVVGVSGGLDSTLALLVSVQAVRELERPLTDVHGITMPAFGTTDRTYNNSLKLMETLGITCKEINIKEACTVHARDIDYDLNDHSVTYENLQARERTQVLMDYAGKVGGLVVGTGDLSELALGWCTYNADQMSMYGVNASIPKTLIKWMIDSISEYDVFEGSAAILKDIIDTPISPELLPPDESGVIAQKTEDVVGPYILHDFFLYNMMRFGFTPSKIYRMAQTAFKDEFEDAVILKWLKTFYRRFFSQQFKRSCMPDGVKVGSICLSPRGDWRMPSDASSAVWLEELDILG